MFSPDCTYYGLSTGCAVILLVLGTAVDLDQTRHLHSSHFQGVFAKTKEMTLDSLSRSVLLLGVGVVCRVLPI